MKQIKWLLGAGAALALLAGCRQEIQVATATFEDSIKAEAADARFDTS